MPDQGRGRRRLTGPVRGGLRARAEAYGGVLSRVELADLGVDRFQVRNQVVAGRWRLHGRQTVALHTGPLGVEARRWRAVWEVGAGVAVVDGVSSLQAAGLSGYVDPDVHVSVVHRHRVPAANGVRLHKVRRRVDDEVAGVGLPRTPSALAAVRAAHWAASDRQAALVLAMPVQQRLVTGAQLLQAVDTFPGRNRRALVRRLALDIADGAHSLGELDFAALCRRRRLPQPSRQVVRSGPMGRVYLDARWDRHRLVVEIDGSGHRVGLALTDDNLRANAVTLGQDRVLRFDLVGLRVAPDAFLDQVELGLQQSAA